ncbi:hypothetical protein ACIBQ1_31890 [Nonomuraea sp. NPDC050153]|uniref:hypothetical protein n=1 Tax=Nonomuraea sp. NPDC050153 TaxID=3364359 RepID=UPI003788366A
MRDEALGNPIPLADGDTPLFIRGRGRSLQAAAARDRPSGRMSQAGAVYGGTTRRR